MIKFNMYDFSSPREALQRAYTEFRHTPDTLHHEEESPEVPILWVNRDSGILDRANWQAICDYMDQHFPDQYRIIRYGHGAVGWVDYLMIPLNCSDTLLTWVYKTSEYLNHHYPCFNDEIYSQIQWEEMIDAVQYYEPILNDRAPKDRAYRAYKVVNHFHNIEISDHGDLLGVSSEDILNLYVKLRWANRGDNVR